MVVRSGRCGASAIWLKLALNIYMVKYTQAQSWNPNSSTLECDDRPAACVVTQQYSSAAFFSLLSDFEKKNSSENFIRLSFLYKIAYVGLWM